MDLYECLHAYKTITLKLIDKTKHGEILEELLDKREQIIKKMGNINFSKEEFKNISSSLGLLELDNELQTLVKAEKIKTKNQIDILRKTREARKNYNNVQESLRFFSGRS
jgi:hypothetical protein